MESSGARQELETEKHDFFFFFLNISDIPQVYITVSIMNITSASNSVGTFFFFF